MLLEIDFVKNFFRYLGTYSLRYILGFFITTAVINYLGDYEFGKFSYLISVASLIGGFASLGFNSTIPTFLKLSSCKEEKNAIMSTAFISLLAAGFLNGLIFLIFIKFTDPDYLLLAIIYSLIFPLGSSNSIKYFFEYNADLKFITIINNLALAISFASKLLGLYLDKPLSWFILCITIEQVVIFVSYLILYRRAVNGALFESFSFLILNKLLKKSLPFLLSGIMITMYMKIDQIMIKWILGEESNGVYSATIRLVEVFYFLPVIIQTTYYPFILKTISNKTLTKIKMLGQYKLILIICSIITTFLIFFAKDILYILYGTESASSTTLLQVYGFSLILIAIGTIRNHLIYYYQLSNFYFLITVIGVFINIILNLIFIPYFGLIGCAYATIISQLFVSIISSLFNKILKDDLLFLGMNILKKK
jgi:O-antigen/teichoic acid export membrane protein